MTVRRPRRQRVTTAPGLAPEEILGWPDAQVQALAFRTVELMTQGKTRGQAALQAYHELRGNARTRRDLCG